MKHSSSTTEQIPTQVKLIKEQLALKLFDMGSVQVGHFILASGAESNLYIDLRKIVSHPQVFQVVADLLYEQAIMLDYDLLCGVPMGAIPLATAVAVQSGSPLILVRKETKDHGLKRQVEGDYEPNQICLLIEDLVTTGKSILEIKRNLEKEHVFVKDVLVILDREQGGREALAQMGCRLHSLFILSEFLDILEKHGRLDSSMDLQPYKKHKGLNQHILDPKQLSYHDRAHLSENEKSKKLLGLMDKKRTNLAVAADVASKTELLELADLLGPEICVLKTHIDAIPDADEDLKQQLKTLAQKHRFYIFEDRKFADIGAIVAKQYKVLNSSLSWIDFVTVHSLPGAAALQQFEKAGVLLLAEMSSEGNLLNKNYAQITTQMAEAHSQFVAGLICRKQLSFNPGIIHFTPGIHVSDSGDKQGQTYLLPQEAIKNGSDVIIVGRGITKSVDPLRAAQRYRQLGWEAYLSRLS